MTSYKASHATGAAQDDDSLRRRNVDSHRDANGSVSVSQVEVDDKKSKKVHHPNIPRGHWKHHADEVSLAQIDRVTIREDPRRL